MPIAHLFLALLVVLVWGMNFIFIKFGLDEFSPLLLCALRFFLASVPAVFFIKPPKVPFKIIVCYGLIMFALQFGLLFSGMQVGMTPGMASLLLQIQVFFSIFFAVVFLNEQPSVGQLLGAGVAFLGIVVVAMHFDSNISLLGFLLVLAASATWGFGNLISKKLKTDNLVGVVVWSSFVACIPMFLLTWMLEGSSSFIYAYEHLSLKGAASLFYIVYAATWIGYGIWNWLIHHHPVGVVAPFTLLVPVIGILSSILILGEAFAFWKLGAALLVISGLCINLLSARLMSIKVATEEMS